MGPRKHVLDEGPGTQCDGAIFWGKDMPGHAWRHCRELCKNGWTSQEAVWVDPGRPKEACIRWGPDPPYEGTVFSRKDMPVHPQRHSALSWLNGSRCHLVSGLGGPNEAAAMRHYVKLLWPLVIIMENHVFFYSVRFDAGLPGFNPDLKNRDPDCKFAPKVQPGSSFGALILCLRMRPRHQKFHKSNPAFTLNLDKEALPSVRMS